MNAWDPRRRDYMGCDSAAVQFAWDAYNQACWERTPKARTDYWPAYLAALTRQRRLLACLADWGNQWSCDGQK